MLWTPPWPVFRLRQTTGGREHNPATQFPKLLSKNGWTKKEKRNFPLILVLRAVQAASSCRLKHLGYCAINFVEQGICISPLIHAVWRLLTAQSLSSENFLSHVFKRRELFCLFRSEVGPKQSLHPEQLRLESCAGDLLVPPPAQSRVN